MSLISLPSESDFSSISRSLERKGITLHRHPSQDSLGGCKNNPQSSPNQPVFRSQSPPGFQIYKQGVQQFHRQPSLALAKSNPKTSSQLPTSCDFTPIKSTPNPAVSKGQVDCQIEERLTQNQLELLRQHFGKVASMYQKRAQETREDHQKVINQLSERVKQVEDSLASKQLQLTRLKSEFQQRNSRQRQYLMDTQFKPALQTRAQYNVMKETVTGLMRQIRDLDRKVKLIVLYQSQPHSTIQQPTPQVIGTLQSRIDRTINQVVLCLGVRLEQVQSKHETMKQFYESSFNKQLLLLQSLDAEHSKLHQRVRSRSRSQSKPTVQMSQRGSHVSFVGINQKIMEIRQQCCNHELSLKSIPDIIKMYNQQYQTLFQSMKAVLNAKTSGQSTQRTDNPDTQTELTQRSNTQSCYLKSQKQQIRPTASIVRSFNQSVNSFRDRDAKPALNCLKLERLRQTFNVLGNRLPVKCETDQTGYLKYADSGTYIFDSNGNLFGLSRDELDSAFESKLIQF